MYLCMHTFMYMYLECVMHVCMLCAESADYAGWGMMYIVQDGMLLVMKLFRPKVSNQMYVMTPKFASQIYRVPASEAPEEESVRVGRTLVFLLLFVFLLLLLLLLLFLWCAQTPQPPAGRLWLCTFSCRRKSHFTYHQNQVQLRPPEGFAPPLRPEPPELAQKRFRGPKFFHRQFFVQSSFFWADAHADGV